MILNYDFIEDIMIFLCERIIAQPLKINLLTYVIRSMGRLPFSE